MHRVTVVTKRGCHICEDTINDLQELRSRYHFQLETLDILDDPSLFDQYWIKVPVIRWDEKDVFEVEELAPRDMRMQKLAAFLATATVRE